MLFKAGIKSFNAQIAWELEQPQRKSAASGKRAATVILWRTPLPWCHLIPTFLHFSFITSCCIVLDYGICHVKVVLGHFGSLLPALQSTRPLNHSYIYMLWSYYVEICIHTLLKQNPSIIEE